MGAVDLSYDRPEFDYTPDENLGDGTVNVTVVGMPEKIRLVEAAALLVASRAETIT